MIAYLISYINFANSLITTETYREYTLYPIYNYVSSRFCTMSYNNFNFDLIKKKKENCVE